MNPLQWILLAPLTAILLYYTLGARRFYRPVHWVISHYTKSCPIYARIPVTAEDSKIETREFRFQDMRKRANFLVIQYILFGFGCFAAVILLAQLPIERILELVGELGVSQPPLTGMIPRITALLDSAFSEDISKRIVTDLAKEITPILAATVFYALPPVDTLIYTSIFNGRIADNEKKKLLGNSVKIGCWLCDIRFHSMLRAYFIQMMGIFLGASILSNILLGTGYPEIIAVFTVGFALATRLVSLSELPPDVMPMENTA